MRIMVKFGYSRVSTAEQDLKIQTEWLLAKGVHPDNIYSEKKSGSNIDMREQLKQLLKDVAADDSVYVFKLDRLARNTRDSLAIMDKLRSKNVTLILGDIGTLENNEVGNLIYTIFSAVAEMERKRIVERTQAGRKYQRDHNPEYREGRRRKLTPFQIQQLVQRSNTESKADLARNFNISRNSVYRYIDRYHVEHREEDKL